MTISDINFSNEDILLQFRELQGSIQSYNHELDMNAELFENLERMGQEAFSGLIRGRSDSANGIAADGAVEPLNGFIQLSGQSEPMPLTREFTIGRSPDNDLVLNSSSVSRHHARLENRDGCWWLTDLGSQNGTCLNGQLLTAPAALAANDQVRAGDITFWFLQSAGSVLPPGEPSSRTDFCKQPPTGQLQAEALVCSHCHQPVRAGAKFCPACGTTVQAVPLASQAAFTADSAADPGSGTGEIICLSCGASLSASARFCNACGHSVTGAA